MAEQTFAVVNEDVVMNIIVAEQKFIDRLKKQIPDAAVDTALFSKQDVFIDITHLNPKPGHGWTMNKKGVFSPPEVPEPTEEELAARNETEQQAANAADDAQFRIAMQDKLRQGRTLTPNERDRLLALS